MNEQDFRNELRRTMATLPARPEMSDTEVLDAARRDLRRRRTMWAGIGSATAVIAVAVGVAVLAPSATDGSGGLQVADQSESTQAAEDPAADRGAQLAAVLVAVTPAGYESPDGLVGANGKPLKHDYANYDKATDEDAEGWAYTAAVPLKKGNGIGELSVTVFGPNQNRAGDSGCQVNPMAMNPEKCAEHVVDGKKVGVFTSDVDGNLMQTAVIQYDDTTVVALTQAAAYRWAGVPRLPGLPFNAEQFAGLTADPRFKIQ